MSRNAADAGRSIKILPLTAADADWLQLRRALWPETSVRDHKDEMHDFIADRGRYAQFIARTVAGDALGFVEASIRTDYVNGTESSPVAFLEGLYVKPRARRQGVARKLVSAVERWARDVGCRELASDALLRNRASHAMHLKFGFAETERVVYFNKRLR